MPVYRVDFSAWGVTPMHVKARTVEEVTEALRERKIVPDDDAEWNQDGAPRQVDDVPGVWIDVTLSEDETPVDATWYCDRCDATLTLAEVDRVNEEWAVCRECHNRVELSPEPAVDTRTLTLPMVEL